MEGSKLHQPFCPIKWLWAGPKLMGLAQTQKLCKSTLQLKRFIFITRNLSPHLWPWVTFNLFLYRTDKNYFYLLSIWNHDESLISYTPPQLSRMVSFAGLFHYTTNMCKWWWRRLVMYCLCAPNRASVIDLNSKTIKLAHSTNWTTQQVTTQAQLLINYLPFFIIYTYKQNSSSYSNKYIPSLHLNILYRIQYGLI